MANPNRIRQLPKIFIRGSIANQTMVNLTNDQVNEIDRIIRKIATSDHMRGDLNEFTYQLKATIGGDYRSQEIATQEFMTALWKATVHLLYHRSYQYSCLICGSTEYTTYKGKKAKIDQQFKICPNCNQAFMRSDPSKLIQIDKKNKTITFDDSCKSFKSVKKMQSECISPIKSILGSKKIENPYEIIDNPKQAHKWFAVWVWNYFRQILRENTISTHKEKQTEISGPANVVAAKLIINELKSAKHEHYCNEENLINNNRCIKIHTNILQTKKQFTDFLNSLIKSYEHHGVEIICENNNISIKLDEENIINDVMVNKSCVEAISSDYQNEHKDTESIKDAIDYDVCDSNELSDLIQKDFIQTIKKNLVEEKCQLVLEILSQTGEGWKKFSDIWGERQACKKHMAEFLNCSRQQVEEYKNIIKSEILFCSHSLTK